MIIKADLTIVFENENGDQCGKIKSFRGEDIETVIEQLRIWAEQNKKLLKAGKK